MQILEIILCVLFLGGTGFLVIKKFNPSTVLLFLGMAMLAISICTGIYSPAEKFGSTGSVLTDILNIVEKLFGKTFLGVGFIIMAISGYVAVMNKMKATDAMVYLATKPLRKLKSNPHLVSVLVIPVCTALFLCINSASGLALLLMATIYPILLNLGVSKPTAMSVIVASVIFDMGPASSNTIIAASNAGVENVEFFIKYQIPLVIIGVICLMAVFYFTNRFFDKKDKAAGKDIYGKATSGDKPDVPLWFAIFPILPLVVLILFSPSVGLVDFSISTGMAMMLCGIVSVLFIFAYKRSFKACCDAMADFFKGMGSSFTSVVILTVAALVFAEGLMSLHFIDLVVEGCQAVNMGAIAVTVVFGLVVLFCAAMMGSGNAAFFAFGPMVPNLAAQFGAATVSMILPIQLLASMGRGVSPIAACVVAVCGITGTNTMDLVKRTMIPIVACAICLLIANFIIFW